LAPQPSQAFLTTLFDQIEQGISVFDASWGHLFSNQAGKDWLDQTAVFSDRDQLERLGSTGIDDLENALDKDALKLVIDGPPPRILETFTRKIGAPEGGACRLILFNDITREQAQYVRAQEQDRLAAMGQLAAGIAHDFNNMLTAMIGYADIMLLGPDTTERQKQNLEIIATQGRRAEQLVRQVLDFSRQRLTRRVAIEIGSLLGEVAGLMDQTLPESVTIDYAEADTELVAKANATQIQESITNLVVNARDAMPSGGRISLSAKRIDVPEGARLVTHIPDGADVPPPSGSWIAIIVSDTGTGMPPEVSRRVFEPFFTTKPETKGTGLGLAQVYGIVRQHDGYLDLQSEVGVGTTFTLYLPVCEEEAEDIGSGQSQISRGNGETVLIVEDDQVVLQAVSAMVDGIGYDVIEAEDGREALAVLDSDVKIDILLTDVVMPGINGVELVRKASQSHPDLPVVMMTGHTLNEEEAIEEQADAFLNKPLSLAELATALKSLVD
jgi:two-component system, cell cycle sensor histidine kinase and response regulator CckA